MTVTITVTIELPDKCEELVERGTCFRDEVEDAIEQAYEDAGGDRDDIEDVVINISTELEKD